MRIRGLISAGLLACCLLVAFATNGAAQVLRNERIIKTPARGVIVPKAANATNHGGPVIVSAKVVFIFWGPSFANAASPDHAYATTIQAFRNNYGTSGEYNVITQYSGSNGTIALTNLASGTADLFDTSTPPANVTDALVRSKVNSYLSSHGGNNTSTIYEVVIPSGSYSSDGSEDSCGGPSLAYCAYHSWIGSGTSATKYSIQPYPSCSGCQVSGWTPVQNEEHFLSHETREAVTDPTGTTWYDSSGEELDDKCAWSPTPFHDGSFSYQYEWSNLTRGCVKTR